MSPMGKCRHGYMSHGYMSHGYMSPNQPPPMLGGWKFSNWIEPVGKKGNSRQWLGRKMVTAMCGRAPSLHTYWLAGNQVTFEDFPNRRSRNVFEMWSLISIQQICTLLQENQVIFEDFPTRGGGGSIVWNVINKFSFWRQFYLQSIFQRILRWH